MKKLLICLVLLLATATSAQALDYYVRTDGHDTNCDGLSNEAAGDGTCAWLTLAKAASTVPDGANHTINVAAGTYAESVTDSRSGASPGYRWWKGTGTVNVNTFAASGSWQKYTGLTFKGTGGASTTAALQIGTNKTQIVIDGCTWSETLRPGIGGNTGSSYVTINNCTFYKVDDEAINLWTNEDHYTITNNDISHTLTGTYDANGLNLHGSNHLVSGNYIYDILRAEAGADAHIDGMQWNFADTGTGTIIENNRIYLWEEAASSVATTYGMMFSGGVGTIIRNNLVQAWGGYNTGTSASPSTTKLYNNTFIRSSAWTTAQYAKCISIYGGTGPHEIKNNICVNFGNAQGAAAAIQLLSGPPTLVSDNNLFWNDDAGDPQFAYSTGAVGSFKTLAQWQAYGYDTSPVLTDPVFVTPPTDLQLQSTSPARDAGATIAVVQTDFAGTVRPQGAAYDIGAYEFGAPPSILYGTFTGGNTGGLH